MGMTFFWLQRSGANSEFVQPERRAAGASVGARAPSAGARVSNPDAIAGLSVDGALQQPRSTSAPKSIITKIWALGVPGILRHEGTS